jgi:hypothetical protein
MQAQSRLDCFTGLFGLLLSRLRHEQGLGIYAFTGMCRTSGEAELRKMNYSSVHSYEIGKNLPHPPRAEALARLLKSPSLLKVFRAERLLPDRYRWKARAGLAVFTEEHCRNLRRAQDGRPWPEAAHLASVQVCTIQDEFTGLGDRFWRYREREKRDNPRPPNAIQDEFTGLRTASWRYEQREKRDNPKKPWTIQDEFTGLGDRFWRYEQRKKKRALEAGRKEARLGKVA